jgi:hypothetical protein
LIAAIPSLPREFRAEFTEFGFFSELITAATGVAVGRDQALVVSPPGADWFIWDRVPLDGVIVIEPVVGEAALPDLRRRGIPFVTIATMRSFGPTIARAPSACWIIWRRPAPIGSPCWRRRR